MEVAAGSLTHLSYGAVAPSAVLRICTSTSDLQVADTVFYDGEVSSSYNPVKENPRGPRC